MDKDSYRDYVLTRLGNPVVNVEVEDLLDDLIDAAFSEIKPYITVTKVSTINFSEKMDLSEKIGEPVAAVVAIYRGTRPISLTDPDQLLFSGIGIMKGGSQRLYLRYGQDLLIRQIKNQFSKDLDFRYEKPYLFAHQNPPKSNQITVEYIPDYENIEDVTDPFWINLLRRMSLGITKETLGRARGKYRLTNSPYEMDADALLSEGREEVERIREKLEENSDLLFPVD